LFVESCKGYRRKGEIVMSRNRKRYREKRKQKKLEERLERVNEYGVSDLTPFMAINQIISKDKIRSEIDEK
jgi:hypothetical protein